MHRNEFERLIKPQRHEEHREVVSRSLCSSRLCGYWIGVAPVLALVVQGCRSAYKVPEWPEVPQSVKSTIQGVSEQQHWTTRNVEASEPQLVGRNWQVRVVGLPPMPGGHATYEIAPTGGVVRIHRGY